MSERPDFRIEQSELGSRDEFGEYGYEDLEYYVDVRGTFDKLPCVPTMRASARAEPTSRSWARPPTTGPRAGRARGSARGRSARRPRPGGATRGRSSSRSSRTSG